MKQLGFVFYVFVLLLPHGISYATTVSAGDCTSAMMPSRVERTRNPEDIISFRYKNHITRYDSASLDSFIRVTMIDEYIPGIATWASKNGQVIWQQCYGWANLEDSVAVTDTTSFMLASISKTVTGTAIMQLWERGEFNLDDDINDHLPFAVRNHNYPDSAITFRMLMTHTSSIHDQEWILGPLAQPGDPNIPLNVILHEYLVPGGTYYSTLNYSNAVPGTNYDYSNVGIALLGYLVETIEDSLDSFPIHCQDSIFAPLDMDHTSWFLAGMDTNNIAVPYHWNGVTFVPYEHYGYPLYPSVQLRSSAKALAQHLTVIQQYGIVDTVRILDSTTVALILSPHFTVDSTHTMGLTWNYVAIGSRWVWSHTGSWLGASTVYGFCPDESSAVIVLTNGESYDGKIAIGVAILDYALQYGIVEERSKAVRGKNFAATIFRGPLQLPGGKKCRVFDITGRVVEPRKIQSGIYFIEVDGVVTQKVVKVR
jgi:CubicO group peptidase (beta-lactamase class C family)